MTSSWMPTVKRRGGSSAASASKTPATIAGRELLGGQPVAAAGEARHGLGGSAPAATASASALATSVNSGSPDRARLLGAVEHAEACGPSAAGRPGSASAGKGRYRRTSSSADPLAAARRAPRRSPRPPRAGAHQHHDPLGLGVADVVDEAVAAAGALARGGPSTLLHGAGDRVVERVGGLAGLEEHVGVLRGAAQHGRVGGQPAGAVGEDVVVVDQRAQVVVAEWRRSG